MAHRRSEQGPVTGPDDRVGALLREGRRRLAPVATAALDSEVLLARVLGVEAQAVVASQGNSRANKRCRNDLLRATGYRLRFPDYRSGYGAVLR